MIIDENIIDNSNTKRSVFLNKVIKLEPNTNFDIACTFLNVDGFALVKENLNNVTKFRLLLGKTPADIYENEKYFNDEYKNTLKH